MSWQTAPQILLVGLFLNCSTVAAETKPIGKSAGDSDKKSSLTTTAPKAGSKRSEAQPVPTEADRELTQRARNLARDGSFEAALAQVEQLSPALKDSSYYFELKGTVQTLTKDYAKAEMSFAEMLARQPDSYVARFNRAEAIMLQGRYQEAETEFAAVEKERSAVDAPVADLARFKRVACLLAQGNFLAAQLLVPPVQEGKESPALSYSRAMILWVRKDVAGAARVMEEARKQFSPSVDDLYTDTFVELNWGVREASGQFKFGPKFR